MRRRLVAKKRGRLLGALVGGTLLGPLGALGGALLNSKTDYEFVTEKPKAPPEKMGTAGKVAFWFLVIFIGGMFVLVELGVTLR
jgi:hypothetical protein